MTKIKTKKVVEDGTVEGMNGEEPFYDLKDSFQDIGMEFTQFYHTTLSLLCRLNKCESDLVMYLSVHMDDNNDITFIKPQKDQFIAFNPQQSGKPYKIETVNNALTGLKKKGLIRELSKGYFRINPRYFFKDNKKKRIDLIRIELVYERGKKPSMKVETK